MTQKLIEAITEMREEDAIRLTNELLDGGTSPADILGACKDAMEVIGNRFEKGECFIPELMLAGEMMSAISGVLKPRMAGEAAAKKIGKIVFGAGGWLLAAVISSVLDWFIQNWLDRFLDLFR